MDKRLFYAQLNAGEESSSDESDFDEDFNPISPNDSEQSEEDSEEVVEEVEIENDDTQDESAQTNLPQAGNVSMVWQDICNLQQRFICNAFETNNFIIDTNRKVLPIDIFRSIVDDQILDLIVCETNRFKDQTVGQTPITRNSIMKNWKPVTKKCIEQFLGLLILFGMNKQPTFASYWSRSQIYGNQLAQSTMSRNRFQLIMKFLHFANNQNSDQNDRLYKLRPLLALLKQNFIKYTPGEKVVIDESLVHFRGRTILRQYIPNKKHKYGLKFYKLCSVEGYTWNFIIYKGKGDTFLGASHGDSIVQALMEGLLNEGRILYVDNFYTSTTLAKHLLEKRTYLCGTLRKNRKYLPKEVTTQKLKRNQVIGKENTDGIKVIKWMDKREVLVLSTDPEHDSELTKTGKKNRQGEEVEKPSCILDYNSAKKGVDFSDQMAAYYSPLRKTKKWYKKAAFELLLGTAVVNAYVLYNKYYETDKLSLKKFRESLLLSLLTGTNEEKIQIGREPSTTVTGGQRSEHFLIEMDGKARDTRKRCRGCYETIKENENSKIACLKAKRVKTYCGQCETKPFLYLSCFEQKHSA